MLICCILAVLWEIFRQKKQTIINKVVVLKEASDITRDDGEYEKEAHQENEI